MSMSEINKLREHLNALMDDDNASTTEILEISREMDELILKYLQEKKNNQ